MDTETVYVLTPGTVIDPYSEESTPSWDVPSTERAVQTLAPPEPRPSSEPVLDARNAVTSGWTLYLPWNETVRPDERVRVRGVEYAVQGASSEWGGVGVVVQVDRTEG